MQDSNVEQKQSLYIFLDEAGNFDFSPSGTRCFVLTSLTKHRPFEAYKALTELKYDLIELGINLEYFHAAEDQQATRNRVFDIIAAHLAGVRIDSLIVEKRKTGPSLQTETRFYPEMLGYLLQYVVKGTNLKAVKEIVIVTDRIPIARKREAIEKAVKQTLTSILLGRMQYKIFHHESKSNMDLQIVDYCNWAIYRKWDREDKRSYDKIRKAIRSEFDIFRTGERNYY
jgi:hypothetical protein